MKKALLLASLFSICHTLFSQKKEAYYLLDKDFKGTTSLDKATYFLYSLKENDSSWLFEKYNVYGPLISAEHYKDEKATTLQGHAIYYNNKGKIDSSGEYKNDMQTGVWGINNEKGEKIFERNYQQGILIDSKMIKKEKPTAADTTITIDLVETESEFPGKSQAWVNYLNKNLTYPERAQNIQKEGTVIVLFIVDKDGSILDPYIGQSVEFSLDQEALRMIKESPKWTPAYQNGKIVKSWKLQPITFKLK